MIDIGHIDPDACAQAGQPRQPSEIHGEGVMFHPDGRTLATMQSGLTSPRSWSVGIWDVDSGELIRELRHARDAVLRAVFSPCGTMLVSTNWVHDTNLLVFINAIDVALEPTLAWARFAQEMVRRLLPGRAVFDGGCPCGVPEEAHVWRYSDGKWLGKTRYDSYASEIVCAQSDNGGTCAVRSRMHAAGGPLVVVRDGVVRPPDEAWAQVRGIPCAVIDGGRVVVMQEGTRAASWLATGCKEEPRLELRELHNPLRVLGECSGKYVGSSPDGRQVIALLESENELRIWDRGGGTTALGIPPASECALYWDGPAPLIAGWHDETATVWVQRERLLKWSLCWLSSSGEVSESR